MDEQCLLFLLKGLSFQLGFSNYEVLVKASEILLPRTSSRPGSSQQEIYEYCHEFFLALLNSYNWKFVFSTYLSTFSERDFDQNLQILKEFSRGSCVHLESLTTFYDFLESCSSIELFHKYGIANQEHVHYLRYELLRMYGELKLNPENYATPYKQLVKCFSSNDLNRKDYHHIAWRVLKKLEYKPDEIILQRLEKFKFLVDGLATGSPKVLKTDFSNSDILLLRNFVPFLLLNHREFFLSIMDSLLLLPTLVTTKDLISIYEKFPTSFLEREMNYLMFRAFYDGKHLIVKNVFLKLIAHFFRKLSVEYQSELLRFLLRYRFLRKNVEKAQVYYSPDGQLRLISETDRANQSAQEEEEEYLLPPCSLQLAFTGSKTATISMLTSFRYNLPDLPKAVINSFLLTKSKQNPFNMLVTNMQYEIYSVLTYPLLENAILHTLLTPSKLNIDVIKNHPEFSPLRILDSYFSIKRYQKESMLHSLLLSFPPNSEIIQEVHQYLRQKFRDSSPRERNFPVEGINFDAESITILLLTLAKNLNIKQLGELREHPALSNFIPQEEQFTTTKTISVELSQENGKMRLYLEKLLNKSITSIEKGTLRKSFMELSESNMMEVLRNDFFGRRPYPDTQKLLQRMAQLCEDVALEQKIRLFTNVVTNNSDYNSLKVVKTLFEILFDEIFILNSFLENERSLIDVESEHLRKKRSNRLFFFYQMCSKFSSSIYQPLFKLLLPEIFSKALVHSYFVLLLVCCEEETKRRMFIDFTLEFLFPKGLNFNFEAPEDPLNENYDAILEKLHKSAKDGYRSRMEFLEVLVRILSIMANPDNVNYYNDSNVFWLKEYSKLLSFSIPSEEIGQERIQGMLMILTEIRDVSYSKVLSDYKLPCISVLFADNETESSRNEAYSKVHSILLLIRMNDLPLTRRKDIFMEIYGDFKNSVLRFINTQGGEKVQQHKYIFSNTARERVTFVVDFLLLLLPCTQPDPEIIKIIDEFLLILQDLENSVQASLQLRKFEEVSANFPVKKWKMCFLTVFAAYSLKDYLPAFIKGFKDAAALTITTSNKTLSNKFPFCFWKLVFLLNYFKQPGHETDKVSYSLLNQFFTDILTSEATGIQTQHDELFSDIWANQRSYNLFSLTIPWAFVNIGNKYDRSRNVNSMVFSEYPDKGYGKRMEESYEIKQYEAQWNLIPFPSSHMIDSFPFLLEFFTKLIDSRNEAKNEKKNEKKGKQKSETNRVALTSFIRKSVGISDGAESKGTTEEGNKEEEETSNNFRILIRTSLLFLFDFDRILNLSQETECYFMNYLLESSNSEWNEFYSEGFLSSPTILFSFTRFQHSILSFFQRIFNLLSTLSPKSYSAGFRGLITNLFFRLLKKFLLQDLFHSQMIYEENEKDISLELLKSDWPDDSTTIPLQENHCQSIQYRIDAIQMENRGKFQLMRQITFCKYLIVLFHKCTSNEDYRSKSADYSGLLHFIISEVLYERLLKPAFLSSPSCVPNEWVDLFLYVNDIFLPVYYDRPVDYFLAAKRSNNKKLSPTKSSTQASLILENLEITGKKVRGIHRASTALVVAPIALRESLDEASSLSVKPIIYRGAHLPTKRLFDYGLNLLFSAFLRDFLEPATTNEALLPRALYLVHEIISLLLISHSSIFSENAIISYLKSFMEYYSHFSNKLTIVEFFGKVNVRRLLYSYAEYGIIVQPPSDQKIDANSADSYPFAERDPIFIKIFYVITQQISKDDLLLVLFPSKESRTSTHLQDLVSSMYMDNSYIRNQFSEILIE